MIYGRGVESSKIADVLLTDDDHSALMHILNQSDTSIRVRLPRMLEPGFYSIVLATRDRETRFLDQGVTIKVVQANVTFESRRPMLEIKHILFPVDFSGRCSAAAGRVASMASHFHAKVTMLHVIHLGPGWYNELSAEAFAASINTEAITRARQATFDEYLRYPEELCRARRVLLEGDPAGVITEFAATEKIDLIMMPTHGYGPFRRLLLGSVTAKVLHDAGCPVWTDVSR